MTISSSLVPKVLKPRSPLVSFFYTASRYGCWLPRSGILTPIFHFVLLVLLFFLDFFLITPHLLLYKMTREDQAGALTYKDPHSTIMITLLYTRMETDMLLHLWLISDTCILVHSFNQYFLREYKVLKLKHTKNISALRRKRFPFPDLLSETTQIWIDYLLPSRITRVLCSFS